MVRSPISEDTQNSVLLKSRRRCCLCFWLHGRDEVMKGQVAHLDRNPENSSEDNLVFLCLEHHDEYDGATRLAKGLRKKEVRHWRDELYREMEYRFRDSTHSSFELSIIRFLRVGIPGQFKAQFRLKNTGERAVRSPVVAIRLPSAVCGELPDEVRTEEVGSLTLSLPSYDFWKAYERKLDLFEPEGRVTLQELGGPNPVLMPGHAFEFEALVFRLADYPGGSTVELEYRVDGEGIAPVRGILNQRVPQDFEELDA